LCALGQETDSSRLQGVVQTLQPSSSGNVGCQKRPETSSLSEKNCKI
jgi:hypothetical protein